MVPLFNEILSKVLEAATSAITYVTDAIRLFIVYIEAELPFFNFLMNMFNSLPQAIRDLWFISVTAAFVAFLFNALRRGK